MTKPDHDHKNCIHLFERLSEYLDKEMGQATCEQVEAHIHDCEPCAACLGTLKRTVRMCREVKNQDVPKGISLKLKNAVKELTSKSND